VRRSRTLRQAADALLCQALRDIDGLKVELEGARTERKHKEEYEARLPAHAARA
jgi:hypothetical protein